MMSDAALAPVRSPLNSHTLVQPGPKTPAVDLPELWRYREVLYALTWREIKIRYAQTSVGLGWVILQPVLTTVVLTLLVGRWMNVPTEGLPYSLFAFSGLAPWLYFTHVLTKSSTCMVNTGLLSKAYFPRLLLPLAVAIGGLIDLFVAGAVLAILMAYFRVGITIRIAALPGCLLLLVAVALGIGIWLAVLNLYYRDVAHALPFVTQIVFFMTPVAYSSALVPAKWRALFILNPMVGVLECWRWALFGKALDIAPWHLAVSLGAGAVILAAGLFYFAHKEPVLADVGDT